MPLSYSVAVLTVSESDDGETTQPLPISRHSEVEIGFCHPLAVTPFGEESSNDGGRILASWILRIQENGT